MKLIFLDIDGVLNNHKPVRAGRWTCGFRAENVQWLNWLLRKNPDAMMVLTSAWRYIILEKDMTVKGFETMMEISGINARGRLIGHVGRDPDSELKVGPVNKGAWYMAGLKWRAKHVMDRVLEHSTPPAKLDGWVCLDDLPLEGLGRWLVKCNPYTGLTRDLAHQALTMLQQKDWSELWKPSLESQTPHAKPGQALCRV